jgi:8-oxo-dGTP pyrophosphatase MutT (NUDIX family)
MEDRSISSTKRRTEPTSTSKTSSDKKLKVQVWIYRAADQAPAKSSGIEVLLLLLKPERGGFWQPVTGGVDKGESLTQAALREANEESGLRFEAVPLSLDYRFTYMAKDREFEEHGYALKAASSQVKLDPHEHVDHRWVSVQDAAEMLKHPSNAEGLSRLLDLLRADRPPATKAGNK